MKQSKFLFVITGLLLTIVLTGQSCLAGKTTTQSNATLGMFRSDDKGENWREANALPTAKGVKSLNTLKVYRFFTDPSDPEAIYVTTRGQGVYYTYDRGDNWREIPDFAGKFIFSMAVDPKNKCVIYATDGVSIFKTTDCSRTWNIIFSEVRASIEIQSVAIDYGNSQVVYAAMTGGETLGGDILISSDAGKSWQNIKHINMDVTLLVTDPLTPRRLYVIGRGSNAGLVRSDDGGITWKDLTLGLQKFPGNLDFYRLIMHSNKKDNLFWISKYGILRSVDAGVTWTEYKLTVSPGSINIYSFAINPTNDNELYFTGTDGAQGEDGASRFYKSADGGKNWITKKLPTTFPPVAMYIHPKEPNMLMLGFTSFK